MLRVLPVSKRRIRSQSQQLKPRQESVYPDSTSPYNLTTHRSERHRTDTVIDRCHHSSTNRNKVRVQFRIQVTMADKPDTRPILIVEDIREISSQMGEMLKGKGQRVIYATDAESAIRMAEDDRPRMILTDLDLPTFDSLIGLVRKHAEFSRMVVAIMDINGAETNLLDQITVLANLRQLDELLLSTTSNH